MTVILKTNTSRELFAKAGESLVGGVASSLHRAADEEYPIYIEYGRGSKLYDVDGNEYIDYMGAFGPMILGYCHPSIDQAVIEQIRKGSHFAAPTVSLNQVSKKLTDLIPCADLVIYQGTGTEANMLCFKLVRAYTGKDKIVKFEGHYHGHSDEEMISYAADSLKMMGPRNKPWKTLGNIGQNLRAVEDIIILPWNDLALLEQTIHRRKHEIAAIIMEPIMCNCEVVFPKPGYLEGVRELTKDNDILLIFDEVITGFRLSIGGAQQYYGVTPDLSSFGKAAAGGFPLAIVAGRKDIMEAGVHPVGTFNANPVSIAACEAALGELEKPGIYEHMARMTKRLTVGVSEIAAKMGIKLYAEHVESIWQVAFGIRDGLHDYRDSFRVDKGTYQTFRKGCGRRGIKVHPSRGRFYTSAVHTEEDVERTLAVTEEVLSEMVKK